MAVITWHDSSDVMVALGCGRDLAIQHLRNMYEAGSTEVHVKNPASRRKHFVVSNVGLEQLIANLRKAA